MKNIDLNNVILYHKGGGKMPFPVNLIHARLLTMKLAIRIIALAIVFAGAAGASFSSSTRLAIPSHQSATASQPIPWCAPGLPGCPLTPPTP
jgi:hypothetical protein